MDGEIGSPDYRELNTLARPAGRARARAYPVAEVFPLSRGFAWRLLDAGDDEALDQARQAAARLCDRDSRAVMEHDFNWLFGEAARTGGVARIWLCHAGNDIVGYAPLLALPSRLNLELGEVTLASHRIQRHRLVGCPLFAPAVMEHEARLTASLLSHIRSALPSRAVLFLLGARADSALYAALGESDTRAHFFVENHGPVYRRRIIRLPNTYGDYVASLGKNTRRDLHRQQRKLVHAGIGTLALRRFTTCSDVETFLDAAIAVSRKTYQWKNLDLGLSNRELLARRLTAAAGKKMMLCHVLFAGSTPVAFQLAFRHRGTVYAHDTGYDPDWAGFSVGNQLLCRIVGDLIEHDSDIRRLDLLYGDTPNKVRFTNEWREEGNFWLLPHTPWGTAVFLSLKACNGASAAAGSLLLRFGMKEKVRQMLRG